MPRLSNKKIKIQNSSSNNFYPNNLFIVLCILFTLINYIELLPEIYKRFYISEGGTISEPQNNKSQESSLKNCYALFRKEL